MKKNTPFLSVVIPAYNEEDSLEETLVTIEKARKSFQEKIQVIVVNNNSTDRTVKIAKNFPIELIHQTIQGYGAAYKKGLRHAEGKYLLTGDADCSYPFEGLKTFADFIHRNEYEFINTNRFPKLKNKNMPLINYIGNIGLSLLAKQFNSLSFKDSQSGMWIFSKEFKNKIDFSIMGNGMSFSQEIKIYADHLDVKCKEIPITYKSRKGEKKLNPIKDGWGNLLSLLRFKKKLENKLK